MRSPSLHTRAIFLFSALFLLLALMPIAPAIAAPPPDTPTPSDLGQVPEPGFYSSPVMFIQNMGQWDDRAAFQVWGGPAGTMWIAKDGSIWLTLMERAHPSPRPTDVGHPSPLAQGWERGEGPGEWGEGPRRGVNLKLTFPGANPAPRLEPFDRLDTVVSYFIGADESQWHPDVPVWGGVRLVDLYPGVDLEISSEWVGMPEDGSKPETPPQRVFAWRLVCRADCAGALENVRLRVEGADALEVVTLDGSEGGSYLRLRTEVGEVTLPLLGVKGAAGPQVQGEVAPRVTGNEVLRPLGTGTLPQRETAVAGGGLVWSTFLGGSDEDWGGGMAVDGNGYVYLAGYTASSNFPTTSGAFDRSYNGSDDAFVVKMSRDGSSLLYATFLGGSNSDLAFSIAVDGGGYAYVTGRTNSSNFPTTWGAFDRSYNGNDDAFVVKMSRDGSSLLYATFLAGGDYDVSWGIAVDGSGYAFVAGSTGSSDFPTTSGAFDRSYNGSDDAFVVKMSRDGSSLLYATFLGGSHSDWGSAIAVDGSGYAYVTGVTSSSDFPTTSGAFDRSYNGNGDAFVVRLSRDGHSLVYASYLGGSGSEPPWGFGIAVSGGQAYVMGTTASSDFPTTSGAFDRTYNGGDDAFVVRLSSDGHSLIYATFLGGSGDDRAGDIALDTKGDIHVAGYTESSDFPTTSGAFDHSHNGGADVFVAKLSADGHSLLYATYLGGSGDDWPINVRRVGGRYIYIRGHTESSDFPTTSGAFDRSYNGNADVFVTKLDLGTTPLNDDINNATVIPASSSSFSRTYTQDTTNATTASDDPYFTCKGERKYHTVWYRITPTVDGTLTVDTNGSDYDTVLAVWRGSRGNLTSVGCDDDGGSGTQSYLRVDVRANTTYYIEVAGYGSGDAGNLTLHVSFGPAADTTPPSISNIRETNDPINRRGCPGSHWTVISADVSDVSGIDWVRLYYRLNGGSWQWKYMRTSSLTRIWLKGITGYKGNEEGDKDTGISSTRYEAPLGDFTEVGRLEYYIKARDNAGNESETATGEVTVQDCGSITIVNVQESADPIYLTGHGSPTTATIRATIQTSEGMEWVRLYYKRPGEETWRYVDMHLESGNIYRSTLGPFSRVGTVVYYIRARLRDGTEQSTGYYTLTVTAEIGGRACETTPVEANISVYIPPSPARADVLMAFDTTGSMKDVLDAAKQHGVQVMQELNSLIADVEFGVVDFRDYPIAPFGDRGDWPYRLRQSITGDRSRVQDAINAMRAGGGNDNPESYTRVLYESYRDSNVHWRSNSRRFLIVFGDEFPHDDNLNEGIPNPPFNPGGAWCEKSPAGCVLDPGPDGRPGTSDDLDFQTVLRGVGRHGITLLYVASSSGSWQEHLVYYWRHWAEQTPGGDAVSLSNVSQLPRVIRNVVGNAGRRISRLTLVTEPSSYQAWIQTTPSAYENISVPASGVSKGFALKISPPAGTRAGEYEFTIKAVGDGAVYGTWQVHVTVSSCDTTPPSITNIRETNDPINRRGCPGSHWTVISADVSDVSGIDWVRLYYKAPGSSSWSWKYMNHTSGNRYEAPLGNFAQAGALHYYIKAKDNANNTTYTSTYTVTVNDCSGGGGTDIFPYETDITGFLPDSTYRVWGWAEDSRYLYLVAVKKNTAVVLVTVDKSTRSVVHSAIKNISGVDGATLGLKWGRVYVVTYTVEKDGACSSPVHWDFWRVNGDTWNHVYRTSHNEGGFIWYLVTTNEYLYAIGDYSPCGSWGTKVVRLDQNENVKVWASETGTKFYSNHPFSTRNKVYFVHASVGWNLYLEEYPENTSTFFSQLTKVGEGTYAAFATDGTNRVVLMGTASADGKVHAIINGNDQVVFGHRSFVGQVWAANNGRFYGIFRERDANQWHLTEINATSRTANLSGKVWSGQSIGQKFSPFGLEENPGFVLNRTDGRKILVTLRQVWTEECTSHPQPLDVALVIDRSGSMNGHPLADAKSAAKAFLGYLKPSFDKAALVSFSDSARLDQALTYDISRIRTAIDGLDARGKTAIGDAIKKAYDELQSPRHRPNATSVIVLLSDGKNNAGSDPRQRAQEAKALGIRIITIGLGGDVDEALLRTIASSPSDYYFAPTSSDLISIYQSIAGSICRPTPPRIYIPYATAGSR